MDNIGKQQKVIEAFRKVVDQVSFVLKENPEQTFPQIYNRLQLQAEQEKKLKKKLELERSQCKRPWFRFLSRPVLQPSALIRTFAGHTGDILSVAFFPDGKRIVSGSWDKTLKLWDTETGEELATLKGHTGEVNACAFSPDGKKIISGSPDKTPKLWSVEEKKEIATINGFTDVVVSCAFSLDGTQIYLGDRQNQLHVLSLENIVN